MVSILPQNRSNWETIGQAIGQNLSNVLPQAVSQGYQRQLGLNALGEAENEIAQAGGDPYKIALAFARAGAVNPNLERALGPLLQTALTQSNINRAFPSQPGTSGAPVTGPQAQPQGMPQGQPSQSEPSPVLGLTQPSNFATPSPFNIMTAPEIDAESQRFAQAVRDPNAYDTRQAQLQKQNISAQEQRQDLEKTALNSGVAPDQLPIFMKVGQKFDPRNPSEWALNTKREYDKVKSNMDKLDRAFIPQLGSALLGRNRESALKRLEPTIKDLIKEGFENEVRNDLTDNYLSPTEVEELIHPLSKEKEASIKRLPKGTFPKLTTEGGFPKKWENPFISYEEALEKAPKELETMQNRLSDFFMKNIDPDTSLLVLRDKLWDERDYDWRQIGPAIRQAESKGLKLTPRQLTELTTVETQPPMQSLPDIFMDLDRILPYLRGNK